MYTGVHEIMEDYIHDETTKKVSEILVLIFLGGIFSMTCLSLGLIILSSILLNPGINKSY